jgi:2-dehydro-3-deoxygalactonokinase
MLAEQSGQLIALDWGTSNLRASLLADSGRVLQTRSTPGGVMQVSDRKFEPVLRATIGDWLDGFNLPMIASGMIGSRQGWVEVPYVDCPASLGEVANKLVSVPVGERSLKIVPGLRIQSPARGWDVMRGEETQVWGADLAPGTWAILPGTHSKWLQTGEEGRIQKFSTHMTGELFGLLTKHSILGRLMQLESDFSAEAFDAGVRHGSAEHAQLAHAIFAARTAGLMNDWSSAQLPDFLSGILIGAEVASMRNIEPDIHPVLIGDDALCQRYERALTFHHIHSMRAAESTTSIGQWRVAHAAGLLK